MSSETKNLANKWLVILIQMHCRFYWNIPTFMCKRHGFDFTNVVEDYGIIQNEGDGFR